MNRSTFAQGRAFIFLIALSAFSPAVYQPHADAASQTKPSPKHNPFLETREADLRDLSPGARLLITVTLPPDHEFTEGIPLHFRAAITEGGRSRVLKEGELKEPARELPLVIDLEGREGRQASLGLALDIPYCTTQDPKLCKFKSFRITQPVSFSKDGKKTLDIQAQI